MLMGSRKDHPKWAIFDVGATELVMFSQFERVGVGGACMKVIQCLGHGIRAHNTGTHAGCCTLMSAAVRGTEEQQA